MNAELKKKSEFIEKLSAMDKTNDALLIREGKMNGADADIDMTHVAEGYIPVAVTNVSDSIVNNLQRTGSDRMDGRRTGRCDMV